MKNLKIGAKIMLGYGVIIVLMLFFAGFVIISNNVTVGNVNDIHAGSKLQTTTKDLMAHFYEARVYARVIYITNDDDAYANVSSNLAEVEEHAAEINSFIAENPSLAQFKDQAAAVVTQIDQWKQQVDKVQAANKSVDSIVDKARQTQLSLSDQSMGILNYQLELSRDEASQEIAEAARLRRIDRLDFGARLAQNVDYVASSFEVIMQSYDLTRVPDSKAVLESTLSELQAFVDDSSLQYNIETGNALLKELAAYEQDLDDFVETYNSRVALITDARSTGEKTLEMINALLSDIDIATENLVGNTARVSASSLMMVIIVAIVALSFTVAFALYLTKIISGPIKKMHTVIDQVGTTGNLSFSEQTMAELKAEARGRDEIGQSMNSFVILIEHLSKTGEQLTQVSQGDLSMEVQQLSDHDTIGQALVVMLKNLNRMFMEINSSTAQVTLGSKQIASGAQSLAQGSTEQASAVQQLSASVAEISNLTQENANMALQAASLAGEIEKNAEKGSQQMDQMMTAVDEINQASQNINKVIKVIDDIAFQTNILALNAAVEAARAGQHGKGFAVVAEEVRNLAAKSAEAAKETEVLIANSMEKAELGARIADSTAASLTDIVSGIHESNRIVNDIARSSKEQSAGITQINVGIDQVAQVVQQNSATAEQSAAASQQLSGQSDMLEQMISQFKLNQGYQKRLPQAEQPVRRLGGGSADHNRY